MGSWSNVGYLGMTKEQDLPGWHPVGKNDALRSPQTHLNSMGEAGLGYLITSFSQRFLQSATGVAPRILMLHVFRVGGDYARVCVTEWDFSLSDIVFVR